MECDFDRLVLYLDRRLDVDDQLEVLWHLDTCDPCREAVYLISVDRDADLFATRPPSDG